MTWKDKLAEIEKATPPQPTDTLATLFPDKREAILKAREVVKTAREGVARAEEGIRLAEAQVSEARLKKAEWEEALRLANLDLAALDPSTAPLPTGVKLPSPGTRAHTLLIFCKEPRRAVDLVNGLGMDKGHANVLLSNAFMAGHVYKLERGLYQTRRNVLVALGVADSLEDDPNDPM